ncbi:MAG: YdcF family protein [Clostridiaceae bacterium]|nr:YdcF family protein [Clostridiaceae bacterium]
MDKSRKKYTKLFYSIVLIIGILGVMDFIFLMLIGTVINFGILFPPVAGVVFITVGLIGINGKSHILRIKNKFLRWSFNSLVILFIFSFVLVEGIILFSARTDSDAQVDYLVILGAGLKGDQITLTFRNRLDVGIEYLKANPGLRVVVTGGQGPGENITEALAMERYLVNNGIEAERIIKEDKATSTNENIKFTKEILLKSTGRSDYKIMIVTSDFHIMRAKMLAVRHGFKPFGLSASTNPYIYPNCCIREYFAVIKSLIIDF